jgi:hypothetical protein
MTNHKQLWSTVHNDGSISIWSFHKDDFAWGVSDKWTPWWVLHPDDTVDYCTILGLHDPSIICDRFESEGALVKKLWDIHHTHKRSGMHRGIKI